MIFQAPGATRPSPVPQAGAARRRFRRAAAAAAAALLLPLVLGTVGAASAAGATRVVSVTGSDTNAGTEAAPWRTLNKALSSLAPGDTLVVHGGTYVEHVRVTLKAGTATAPIVVRAAAGERPVVKGLLWLTSPTWWTFDGLNVTWDPTANTASEHMVKLTGGSNWTFKNAEVWGARSYAGILVSSSPSNWRITGNCIHDTYPTNSTNQDHNIYVNSGLSAGPGSIDHNLLFNATNGRNVKLGAPSIGTTNGTQLVTIAWNTMFNASQNVSISGSSRNNLVDHNLVVKSLENHSIYGYSLDGTGNVAKNNVGFGSTKLIDGTNITDGGGNVFPRDPKFDSVASCQGFHPTDSVAQGFGAFADGTTTSVPTAAPTATPSVAPTATPAPSQTAAPSATPTATPAPVATPAPTATPVPTQTATPTTAPALAVATPTAVAFHGSTSAGNASTSSLTLAAPSGTRSGDELLAGVTVRGGTSPAISAPAGWTLIRSDAISTTLRQVVFVHRATTSDPASWTWTFSKAEAAAGTLSAFANVDADHPIASVTGSPNATSSMAIATAAAASTRSDSLLVDLSGMARAASITPAGGLTEGAEATSTAGSYYASSEVSYLQLGAIGSTSQPTAKGSAASVSIGQLVVLNPAS